MGLSAVALLSRPNLHRAACVLLLAGAIGLTGCGRRGLPEAPSAAVTTAQPGATGVQPASPATPVTSPKPDKPFILDPLLR